MNWTIPTQDDLNSTLAAPLVKALKRTALGKDQGDPLELFLGEAVQQIRIAITEAGLAVSATAGSIPPSLLRECAWLAVESASARLPGFGLSSLQKSKIAEAKSTLRKVESKSQAIERPDDPIYPQTLTSTAKTLHIVSKRQTRITSQNLRNL